MTPSLRKSNDLDFDPAAGLLAGGKDALAEAEIGGLADVDMVAYGPGAEGNLRLDGPDGPVRRRCPG